MKPRWLYGAFFVVLASQGRFISLVLKDSLSFSDSEVGLILGCGVISSMIATPFWSRKADGPEGCIAIERKLIAMHALFFGSFSFAAMVVDNTVRFILVAFLRFLASSCMSHAYTLKTIDDKNLYGRERLWGAVSWAGASIVMGFAMDTMNGPLQVCMIFLIISTFVSLLLLRFVPDDKRHLQQEQSQSIDLETSMESDTGEIASSRQIPLTSSKSVSSSGPTSPSLWSLWHRDPKVIIFFYVTLVMGAATSIVENLLFLFMRKDLDASYTLCGISVVITVMFEIPLFFVGKSLLTSIGTLRLLLIGMACYFTRVVGYTLIEIPWTVLLLEPLHGITFASIQTASVAFIHARTPSDRVTEGQGMFSFVRSTGTFLGTTIGSKVLETYGSTVMYRISAIIVTVSAAILVITFKTFGDDHAQDAYSNVLEEQSISTVELPSTVADIVELQQVATPPPFTLMEEEEEEPSQVGDHVDDEDFADRLIKT